MAHLLALVPPTASGSLAAVIYVHVGALSVMMWDIICHLKQDYRLLYTDFCVKTFLYYLCRTTTVLYTLTKTVYLMGVTGNVGTNSFCQDRIGGEWVGAAFVTLFVYHAVVLAVVIMAVKQNVSADRENLKPHERYGRMARKKSLYLVKPLTTAEHVFFLLTTVLSMAVMIWFFASGKAGASSSVRLTAPVVYLVCSTIAIGRILRQTKFDEEKRRKESALSPQIKLETPARRDLYDSVTSTTRIIEPSFNEARGAHCDVIGLFETEPQGCIITIPPVVEIEVKQVVESGHDGHSRADSIGGISECSSHLPKGW
ncbi:hypothetical protein HYPSUDRAFT_57600 [Hypholoma sublateritium FD-334 SS-4]|uniref:Uncharacterized protein n=1 Tax=Hypholoma sublateritium (strain FD-334 SS-4) TaxID=945553 RepID=A0A0D2M3E8_HYPSF|nr:hypothetical protein HYPSUDRAFT_57600 [Hypholoma sublateritium FD-334 SS-4]